jgi:hypothetical protein
VILNLENARDEQLGAAQRQAQSLDLDVRAVKLERPPYDFDAAFQALAERSPEMLLVLPNPVPARFESVGFPIGHKKPASCRATAGRCGASASALDTRARAA